jgi:hypothetical protein
MTELHTMFIDSFCIKLIRMLLAFLAFAANMTPEHILLGYIDPSQQQKYLGNGCFLMHFQ